MRIFLTGANGFVGSKLVNELIGAGHHVLGLTRSDEGAQQLGAAGAKAHRGDIENLDSLRAGAAACEGVIHTAFDHNFSTYVANCRKDGRAIEALGAVLEGSNRPLVITSTTLFGEAIPGLLADEDTFNAEHPNPRVTSELAGRALVERGVNVSAVRLSQTHDTHKQGLVTFLIELARQTGRSAYVGDGANGWSAAHVTDTVKLFRLALEKQAAGARYHATAEEGVPVRSIAEAIGQHLGLPIVSLSADEAAAHFGWLNGFVGKDIVASSKKTRERLNWQPTKPGLLADLANLEVDAA